MMITTILEPLNYKHHPHTRLIIHRKPRAKFHCFPETHPSQRWHRLGERSQLSTRQGTWRRNPSTQKSSWGPWEALVLTARTIYIIVYNEWKYWDLQLDHTCKKWNHVWKLLATRSFTSFSLNLPRKLVDTHDARMDAIHELHQIRNDLHSLTSSWVLDTCIMHEHIQR